MRKKLVILKQAQQISKLKQELLLTQNLLNEAKRMPNIITALSKTELDCKNEDAAMKVKSVMLFGLGLVGFGVKRQNIRNKLNLQLFRSHFGIGPEAIIPIIADIKHNKSKRENIILSHLLMTLCWLKLYENEHVISGRWGFGEEFCRDTVKQITSRLQCLKANKI